MFVAFLRCFLPSSRVPLHNKRLLILTKSLLCVKTLLHASVDFVNHHWIATWINCSVASQLFSHFLLCLLIIRMYLFLWVVSSFSQNASNLELTMTDAKMFLVFV